MFSTEEKITTKRTAKAQAVLRATPELIESLRAKSGPKGDALEIARAAGAMAAKRTWELIPYCHPMPIDHIGIEFKLGASNVTISAEVTAIWKTGVEMEALLAAQLTATALFDMLKPLDNNMAIENVRVLNKTGGKTSFQERIPKDFKVAVIVTSDGTAAGTRRDQSGQVILERMKRFGIEDPSYLVLPDEQEKITEALQRYCNEGYQLIVTTGGTGLGPRDVTADATAAFVDREIPGIMETARHFGQQRMPYAMLSRGIAGLKGKTIIINCPGSSRGTAETLSAIFPAVLHGYKMMAGGGHD